MKTLVRRTALVYTVDEVDHSSFISWTPEDEPEGLRVAINHEVPLKGDALTAFAEALVSARDAVEQPSLKAREKALRRVGFKPGREPVARS